MLTVRQQDLADVLVESHYHIEHYGTGQNIPSKQQALTVVTDNLVEMLSKTEPDFDHIAFRNYITEEVGRRNAKKAEEDAKRRV